MELPRGQLLRADTFASDETLSCDVVVIGTGAGGAAAGVQLAEAGLSVAFRAKPVVRAKATCAFMHCGLDGLLNLYE